jgi:acyl dehydratase
VTIDIDRLTGVSVDNKAHAYTRRDACLYALGVGFATDPLNEQELDFVTDRPAFKSVPTMAAVFTDVIIDLTNACQLQRPELALHGEQKLEIFAPLPSAAELEISGSIPVIYDRGPSKGAEIHMVAEARLRGGTEPLYRATYVTIARGDGGFGGPKPDRSAGGNWIPKDSPDNVCEFSIRPNQALLYSLNGDPNPIHTQPAIARKAGFDAPIMHGLGTYGMACRAVLGAHCDYDPSSMQSFDVRFSAPVFPGETLVVESWRLDQGVAFQARVRGRDILVLKNGYSRLA